MMKSKQKHIQLPKDTPTYGIIMYKSEIIGNCLVFTGFTDEKGYGIIHTKGKTFKVHRWIYQYFNGRFDSK